MLLQYSFKERIEKYPLPEKEKADILLGQALQSLDIKLVVLDDDPTGIQTVHGVSVYTDWTASSILEGFQEENRLFFILTNSRAMTSEQSAKVHSEIAEHVVSAARITNKRYMIISRSDSTLRGHYPLETNILRDVIEKYEHSKIDGEIICPFLPEGGRYTEGNIHYVLEKEFLIPAGDTEFAEDKTFGYKNSHLGMWVEEKTRGEYTADSLTYISLDELRRQAVDCICNKLMQVEDFSKVIVNAMDYYDLKIFTVALYKAIQQGKRFMLRSAASIVKILGGIEDRPLLSRQELVDINNPNGGIVLVGSHVKKTTLQLAKLKECPHIKFIEFDVHLVHDDTRFQTEIQRVISEAEHEIRAGRTVAVFTRRKRLDLNTGNKEDELQLAEKISNAVTSIIASLTVRPRFIIAKGGITSSDVGTKGLQVKKALVLGQILPGIPVWLTGEDSKFPNMPYVIFPGNVGNETALKDAVEKMQNN